jgi:hypothetical protein
MLKIIALRITNSSSDSIPLPTWHTPPATSSPVRINTFWFLSLVLSLIAALFGFLLKGWIREYMRWTEISPPQDAVGLRQYRYEGLQRWQLPLVLATLPGLLQAALLLFFCGLFDFLWHLNPVVAAIIGTITIGFLTLAILTAILPIFSRSSPFKSPLSRMFLRVRFLATSISLRSYLIYSRMTHTWWFRTALSFLQTNEFWRHDAWEELDLRGMKAQDGLSAHSTGCDARVRAIHHIYSKINDEELLEKVRPCLYEINAQGVRYLPMVNCWPIASTMLGFEDSRRSARAVRHLEVPSSRAYDSGRAATVKLLRTSTSTSGFSIYNRAGAMPQRIKHLLSSLILEAAASENGATRREVLINAMYLLPTFIADDSVLIRRYILMLAPLVAGDAPPDIQALALTHLQIATSHVDQTRAGWEHQGQASLT